MWHCILLISLSLYIYVCVFSSIAWAGYTLLLYDYILTLRDEATYIWPTRWSIVKSIYMFNRYGNLLGLAILCAHINGFLYLNTKSV